MQDHEPGPWRWLRCLIITISLTPVAQQNMKLQSTLQDGTPHCLLSYLRSLRLHSIGADQQHSELHHLKPHIAWFSPRPKLHLCPRVERDLLLRLV